MVAHISVVLGNLRQEGQEFEARVSYIVRLSLKKQKGEIYRLIHIKWNLNPILSPLIFLL